MKRLGCIPSGDKARKFSYGSVWTAALLMEKYKEEVKKDHVKSGVDIGWGRPGKCGNLPIFIKT
jgi:hypothetical protein